ncbi:MAG: response regulator transcription factor [Deltaproteobacteria bacterium]
MEKRPPRILVVEDDELIQAAFCLLVQSFEGIELAGRASTGLEALKQAKSLKPDLILMDLRLPDMDGVEATRRIKAVQPGIKVVALTALEDPLQITQALEQGMDGFLLKKASPQELKLAIETVVAGEQYLSPQVSAIMAKAYLEERSHEHDDPAPALTPREKQVLQQIAAGMRLKEIAWELKISERTVEKHCEQARKKLKAATTGEMVALWLRMQG